MKNKSTFLGIVVLVLLVLGTIYSLFIRPAYYKFNGGEAYLTPVSNQRLLSGFTELIVIGDYIYECNKNGLIKKSIDGETVWSKGFYINDPQIEYEGEYIAIADITGKSVYVFNQTGFVKEIKESYPINNIHINKEGFLTTILDFDKQNIINYYNNEGVKVLTRGTRFFEDGYPIDVVTSQGVTKMMTGYLNISNNRLQTRISFFGFDDQYDKYDENAIGGYLYENALLSDLYWLSEDNSLAVLDNELVIYECANEPSIIASIPVEAELSKVEHTKNEIIVWYGDALIEGTLDQDNKVVVYDYDGKIIATHSYDEPIRNMVANGDNYFVMTSSQIIKYKGKSREWFASTNLTVNDFYEVSDNRYVVVSSQGYEILKIRER